MAYYKSGVNSPSKFHTRQFLSYLRANHYISKSGVEFSQCEVDSLYFQKCTELATTEVDSIYIERKAFARDSDNGWPPNFKPKKKATKPKPKTPINTYAALWQSLDLNKIQKRAGMMPTTKPTESTTMTAQQEKAALKRLTAKVKADDRQFNKDLKGFVTACRSLDNDRKLHKKLFDLATK